MSRNATEGSENTVSKRNWLIKIRTDKNMTQEQVAIQSDIERAYYTQIELGVRRPSVSVAKRIASALDFDWTVFFDNKCSESEQNSA